jgi:hypothetical protein
MNYNWFSTPQLVEQKMKSYQQTAAHERRIESLRTNTQKMEVFGHFFLALNFATIHNR